MAQDGKVVCFSARFVPYHMSLERLCTWFCSRFKHYKQVDFGVPVWYDRNRYQTGRIPKNESGFCRRGVRALPVKRIFVFGEAPCRHTAAARLRMPVFPWGQGKPERETRLAGGSPTYSSPFVQL